MPRIRSLAVALVLTACAGSAQTPSASPASGGGRSLWTADFMRTKPGQQQRYLRYVDANWAKSRRTVLAQGGIRSFRVLVVSADSAAPWDVVLLTEYPDSAAYARAEQIFRPVLDAQGETLIDGLSGRGPDNALKTTVLGTRLRSPISGF